MMEGLKELLKKVKNGELEVEEALKELKFLPYKDLDHTKIDTHRELRRGHPEAILCEGKSNEQILDIISEYPDEQTVIATRADEETYEFVKGKIDNVVYHEKADIIQVGKSREKGEGVISVVTGGTSDEKVAEECAVSAEIMGNEVRRIYDVGMAGVHRIFSNLDKIRESSVVVVIAGMEGALPGLVSGLVSVPVIGVPTSEGYGLYLGGISPLLTMLNSCSPGISVVNIDNGYGAAYQASLINEEK
ncbi:1-(5-phosphoribosyl)-5-amino-4-imidazole-carboxylate carboxylase [candidate division MSBL1 archaeon SCGC-AAA259A05]|uniref:1-(5-phosphoribosyl)-5-amino-4-imidazole-carboxylate carboxylase n=1 Tax=candidate division MSBL1 archaeon SCGC-AAA259A05 TaxID=1698259 RepID=A0A133UA29_9EURY|nr:1-(5-phosphoribosyl)-5-amino-4-imidazole-carboxylate carboxylase [candidate division MSBL1 archaeon SCGC-AAA259A05]